MNYLVLLLKDEGKLLPPEFVIAQDRGSPPKPGITMGYLYDFSQTFLAVDPWWRTFAVDWWATFLAVDPAYRKFGMSWWVLATGYCPLSVRCSFDPGSSVSFPIVPLPQTLKRLRLPWDIAPDPRSWRSLRLVLRTERCESVPS